MSLNDDNNFGGRLHKNKSFQALCGKILYDMFVIFLIHQSFDFELCPIDIDGTYFVKFFKFIKSFYQFD